ncbi:imm11 family protein [Stigmatella ashevillensis]
MGDLLTRVAPHDVQLFPVEIEMQRERYFLVNVIRIVKCIDDQASEEVSYWTEKDGLPEKVGTYFSVAGMRIDPTQVGDAKVFRTWGWHIALIVSEEIKDALEHIGATGTKFKEV